MLYWGGNIKRKIIRHGPSSYIVSLPLNWIRKSNISRGDEVSVEENGSEIIISTGVKDKHETIELNLKETKEMTSEIVQALYKRGVDEILATSCDCSSFALILDTLEHEATGFEVIETTKTTCTIKSITTLTNEFEKVLRRVFLVTLSLADEGLNLIKENSFDSLTNVAILEKSNNKLTTYCRRYMNKYNCDLYDRIGPTYYIIELLEKIADQYKYLYDDLAKIYKNKNTMELNEGFVEPYTHINQMLRGFYETFYKFDYVKINKIKQSRKHLLEHMENVFKKIKTKEDIYLYHHARNLIEKIFALVDPYLIIAFKTHSDSSAAARIRQ